MCGPLAVAFTSLLFYLRVRAVYMHSRSTSALFGLFWLITVGLNIFACQKILRCQRISKIILPQQD